MDNQDRIYVQPNGLRCVAPRGVLLSGGCRWEDEEEDQDEDEGPHPAEPEAPQGLQYWIDLQKATAIEAYSKQNSAESDLHEMRMKLVALEAALRGPSRVRLAAEKVRPLLQRLVRGAPCAVVWAGMLATFFWNAAQSFDEQALANVIDLPDEVPARLVAAAISTAVFGLWSICFKTTIQNAVERKLDAAK